MKVSTHKMSIIRNIQAIKRFLGKPIGESEFNILSRMSETKLEEIRGEWLEEYNKEVEVK